MVKKDRRVEKILKKMEYVIEHRKEIGAVIFCEKFMCKGHFYGLLLTKIYRKATFLGLLVYEV